MSPAVSVVECSSYKNCYSSIKKSVDLIGGINSFVDKDDIVLIKPNLLAPRSSDSAVTTHPEFVRSVIKLVKKSGAKIYVGDSPGFSTTLKAAEKSGLKKICDLEKVTLTDLGKPVTVHNPKGKIFKTFELGSDLEKFTKIINLPKMKTHTLTTFTGAVKNMFGTISGKKKVGYHVKVPDISDFSDMLIDLYLYHKNKTVLHIMDGIVGMEGQGPNSGTPAHFNTILASDNAMSLDVIASKILNLNNVPTITVARKRRIKESFEKNIDLRGNYLPSYKIKLPNSTIFLLLNRLMPFAKRFLTQKPYVINNICTGCATCKEVCPKDAITIIDNLPHFNYEKCIRCYCCQELCPKKAITLKKNILSKILGK